MRDNKPATNWHGTSGPSIFSRSGNGWEARARPARMPMPSIFAGEDGRVRLGNVGGQMWNTSWRSDATGLLSGFEGMISFMYSHHFRQISVSATARHFSSSSHST
jgi:hypothetical protein